MNYSCLILKSSKLCILTLYKAYLMISNQKILAQPSIWPLKRSLGKKSLKYIEPTLIKMLDFYVSVASPKRNFIIIFYFFIIHRYDIYNKILKLDLFGNFYFWPLLASFRGYWKTFLLELIQQWLVGRFEGLIKWLKPTWNESKILNSQWATPLST